MNSRLRIKRSIKLSACEWRRWSLLVMVGSPPAPPVDGVHAQAEEGATRRPDDRMCLKIVKREHREDDEHEGPPNKPLEGRTRQRMTVSESAQPAEHCGLTLSGGAVLPPDLVAFHVAVECLHIVRPDTAPSCPDPSRSAMRTTTIRFHLETRPPPNGKHRSGAVSSFHDR
jgi:hypothetical protein